MKANILRGKLLKLLREVYPEGVDRTTVLSIFFQYHKTGDIDASLEYLVDKGYVLKRESPHPYLEQELVRWYKLTPPGMDLLEGNVDADPGILIFRG
ncbi:MAG: hypothetical protein LBO80_07245 [Treponema sp.]|jgi:hypothetical protein|nr:hypothetical protein [Treponema sp.]